MLISQFTLESIWNHTWKHYRTFLFGNWKCGMVIFDRKGININILFREKNKIISIISSEPLTLKVIRWKIRTSRGLNFTQFKFLLKFTLLQNLHNQFLNINFMLTDSLPWLYRFAGSMMSPTIKLTMQPTVVVLQFYICNWLP